MLFPCSPFFRPLTGICTHTQTHTDTDTHTHMSVNAGEHTAWIFISKTLEMWFSRLQALVFGRLFAVRLTVPELGHLLKQMGTAIQRKLHENGP